MPSQPGLPLALALVVLTLLALVASLVGRLRVERGLATRRDGRSWWWQRR